MLTIHHLGISQSERIIWLCEELSIPYTLKRYERARITRTAPPEYLALHPMGLAPVIEIDGMVLAETGAIIEYIVHRLAGGRLQPAPADPNYAEFLFWFHFANSTLMPSEITRMVVNAIPWSRPMRKAVRYRSDRGFALTEARLAQTSWLAGDEFTTADILMAFPFTTMRRFTKTQLDDFPNIRAWLTRIGTRPAYQRAMQIAEPKLPR
jgi:glutathione S-transferase